MARSEQGPALASDGGTAQRVVPSLIRDSVFDAARSLFGAERNQRVHAHRPARGYIAREHRDGDEQQRHRREGDHVGRLDREQKRPHRAGDGQASRHPEHHSGQRERQRLAEHEAHHTGRRGSEREPYPDIARPERDDVGHDAEEADAGEHESDRSKA